MPPLAPTEQEDPVSALRSENASLKQSLLRLREEYQELQEDSKFHQVKVAEMHDILQLRSQDAFSEKLVATSMQNAELNFEINRLRKELTKASATVDKLGGQKEQNKVMLLELCDIVKALQSVDVEYDAAAVPKDSKNMSLANIKKKVETIMEDRRLLVRRCKELEHSNEDKAEKLISLEAQYHLLNSMNYAKGDTTGPPDPLADSISDPTDDDSAESTNVSSSVSHTSASYTAVEPLEIDMNVIRSPIKESAMSDEETCAPSEDASAFSAVHVHAMHTMGEPEEVERLKSELRESNQRYDHFMTVCQTAFAKMKDVERRFTQVQEDLDHVTEKRDFLRQQLKDVIDQYKELHEDHNEVVGNLDEANSKIQVLERLVGELEVAKKQSEEDGIRLLEESGLADDVEKLTDAYLKAKDTITTLESQVASANRVAEEAEKQQKSRHKQFRNAVAQCQKLKVEKTEVETKLSETEMELKKNMREMMKHKSEAKNARRRLTSYVQKKVDPVVDISILQERQEATQQMLLMMEAAATGKAWNKRYSVLQEKKKLAVENKDLRALCVEMLNDMGGSAKQ